MEKWRGERREKGEGGIPKAGVEK